MSSPCDPRHAPVGDVGAALMMIDSQLKKIRGGTTALDPAQQALIDQFAASLSPEGVDDVLDGVCTLIYVFMKWLRAAYEAHDKDVIEHVVPHLVATLRKMPKSVRPETVPTMAGLVVAAGLGLSPSLWRRSYGPWTPHEMNSLEATAVLIAEHIDSLTDDPDFATRLITDALSKADEG
ncbi:hypothetical protein [Streptomyces sp. NPDC046985]|uniref:hypothetical protein n=1 Tax=Streptomyces sp. NPDC046985 TaxID=3155377 RepID=UPI0034071F5D